MNLENLTKQTLYELLSKRFSKDEKKFLGITDGLIRVSIGLENPQDIIDDFLQAR
jgi:cystathionine beta-lyase/cystathionine gamma-synthase